MATTDFNAVNGTLWSALDAAWTDMSTTHTVSNGEVQDNVLQTINATGDELGGYYSTSSVDYSQADILAGAYGNAQRFVSVRGAGGGVFGYGATFIQLAGDIFGGIAIYGGTTGTTTWIANIATGLSISRLVDHTLAIKATGTGTVDFEVWLDGTSVGTLQLTGSLIDTGSPGLFSKWITQGANRWDNWTDVEPVAATITLDDIPSRTTFQRIAGVADIPVTGTCSGATSIEARVMSGAVEIVTWAVIDAAPTTTYSGVISAPTGGLYTLEVRKGNEITSTAVGINPWQVGDLVMVILQSNGERWFTTGTTPVADPLVSIYNTGWTEPTSAMEGATAFGNKYVTDSAVPIGLVDAATGGSALRQEADSGAGYWLATGDLTGVGTEFTDVFEVQLAAVGGCSGVVEVGGERDAISGLVNELEFETSLTALHAHLRTATGNASLPIICSYLGRSTDPAATDTNFQAIRNGQKTVIEADANCNHAGTMDLALADTIHYSDYTTHAERCAQALLNLTGDVTYSDGPIITSATLISSTQIDVHFLLDGGNNLSPNTAATGFEVFDDGVPVAITTVDRADQTTYSITLTAAMVGVATLRYQYGVIPVITNPIYDNSALALPAIWQDTITAGAPSTVVITSVDTDDDIYPGQTAIVVVGTSFGATQGTSRLNSQADGLGIDIAQSVTGWTDTEVQFTCVQGNLPYGTAYLFVETSTLVENAVGYAVTLSAALGYTATIYTGPAPNPLTTESFVEQVNTDHTTIVAVPDYLETLDVGDLTIDGSWQPTISNVTDFAVTSYRFYDASIPSWTTSLPVTIYRVPILTSAILGVLSSTSLATGITTDVSSGTLWQVVTQSAIPPSYADIISGLGADWHNGGVAITTIGAKNNIASGLVPSTTYYAHSFHDNGGGYSTIISSASATTLAVDPVITPGGKGKFITTTITDMVDSTIRNVIH